MSVCVCSYTEHGKSVKKNISEQELSQSVMTAHWTSVTLQAPYTVSPGEHWSLA